MKRVRWFNWSGGERLIYRFGGKTQDNAKIDYFVRYHLRPSTHWQNPRFWIENLCCYISDKELEQKLLPLGYIKNKDNLYKIELHNVFCIESKDEIPSMEEIITTHRLYINSRNELLHPLPYEIL